MREALRQAPFPSQLQHFFDDLPPDVFILVLLADDDGQLAGRPQADVTTKHTPILDIKQFPVCIQIMIHPLQQRQIINGVPVIYLFAELCILIPRKCCIVGRIIRNNPDVPLHRNRTAHHVHRFSVHRPHSLLCRVFKYKSFFSEVQAAIITQHYAMTALAFVITNEYNRITKEAHQNGKCSQREFSDGPRPQA